MKSTATIDAAQVEEMQLSVTFTMPVKEWRALMRKQPADWPAWDLARHIAEVLEHVTMATQMQFSDPKETP